MKIKITDQMIYAYAGEPEITATDAHCISKGLEAVFALVNVPVPLTRKYAASRVDVRTAYRCGHCDQIVWWCEADGPIGNQGCWCVDPRDEDKPERFVVVYHLPPAHP